MMSPRFVVYPSGCPGYARFFAPGLSPTCASLAQASDAKAHPQGWTTNSASDLEGGMRDGAQPAHFIPPLHYPSASKADWVAASLVLQSASLFSCSASTSGGTR